MAKVLVVDDSADVRTIVERVLRDKHIDVVSVASGSDAVARFRRDEPNLVVSDVIVPDMDGYEICQAVRDHPRLGDTPVLLMSGIVDDSVLARAAAVRASDVIRKPVAADQLLDRIEELLGLEARAAGGAGDASTAAKPSAEAPPFAEDAKSVLSRLAAVPGVALAALVDREGFLIESAGDLVLEAETDAALAASLAEASEMVGRDLGQGALVSLVAEYEAGLVLVNSAGAGAMLATVLCDPTLLGRVRHHITQTLPDLAKIA
jgi:CheY-like chemotaxis protein/predicted regulator of Ras-like GTPase activity (Roadblock/LC7/MglB family)